MNYYVKKVSVEAIQVKQNNMDEILVWCQACEPIFEFVELIRSTSANKDYLRSFDGFMVHNSKGSTCANIGDFIVYFYGDYIVLTEAQFKLLFNEDKKLLKTYPLYFDDLIE